MNLDGVRNAKFDAFQGIFKFQETTGIQAHSAGGPIFSARKGTSAYKELADARSAKAPDTREHIGLGILRPRGHNRNSDDYRLGIFVQRKKLTNHTLVEELQELAKGECKVIFTGAANRHAIVNGGVARPLVLGASIGHHRVSAGTLGAFAANRMGGGVGILSNNHVLADVNKGAPGDVILQPAKHDGGEKKNKDHHVALLHKFIPIEFSPGSVNFVDCAFAYLLNGVPRNSKTVNDPVNAGENWQISNDIEELLPTDPVKKVGRTTGLTHGHVEAVEIDNVYVNMSFGTRGKIARFDRQVAISGKKSPFSKGGDSGSLILTGDNKPAALLFAGTERGAEFGGLTYANPIGVVLDALEIDIYLGL